MPKNIQIKQSDRFHVEVEVLEFGIPYFVLLQYCQLLQMLVTISPSLFLA